jgi:hypothetical protein
VTHMPDPQWQPPAPGWYQDPSGAPRQRYFDGQGWTEHYAPLPRTPKTTNRKVWPWVAGGVAIVLVCFAVGGQDDKPTPKPAALSAPSSAQPHPTAPANPTAAPAGSAVRDGKFEFRVLGVERSKSVAGVIAQGEFVLVTLSIENTGDQARRFYGGNQKLVDTSGREFSFSSMIDYKLDAASGDINPGLSMQSQVAFDVPPGAQVRELILHDSMFSGGAHLQL